MSTKYWVGPTRSGGAPQFTTIATACTAIPNNLTGLGIHEVIIDAATYSEYPYFGDVTNTSSADYVIIRAIRPEDQADDPSNPPLPPEGRHKGIFGAGVVVNGQFHYAIPQYTRFIDIEARAQGTGFTQAFSTGSGTYYLRFINCLAKIQPASGQRQFGFGVNGNGSILYKCAVWCTGVGGGGTAAFAGDYGAWTYSYNCIFYKGPEVSPIGWSSNNGARMHCWNCVTDATDNAFYPGSSNNRVGALSLNDHIDYTNGNFHVMRSSILLGAGVDKSSEFTTDIDGDYIREWMQGYDYVSPSCWSYKAKYKNSDRVFSTGGPDKYPSTLRVPKNVDISTGRMTDEDLLIDTSLYTIKQ